MRIIVTGGRDYENVAKVRAVLSEYDEQQPTIVHGACRTGADAIADRAAQMFGYDREAYPANWDRYGFKAGPRRNEKMVSLGADLVIAFPGGRGTADCVRRAKAAGIPIREVQ